MNCGKNFHRAAASLTLKNINEKDTFHQLRPSIVAVARRWRRLRHRLGIDIRRR
jgi:hypothetical protein